MDHHGPAKRTAQHGLGILWLYELGSKLDLVRGLAALLLGRSPTRTPPCFVMCWVGRVSTPPTPPTNATRIIRAILTYGFNRIRRFKPCTKAPNPVDRTNTQPSKIARNKKCRNTSSAGANSDEANEADDERIASKPLSLSVRPFRVSLPVADARPRIRKPEGENLDKKSRSAGRFRDPKNDGHQITVVQLFVLPDSYRKGRGREVARLFIVTVEMVEKFSCHVSKTPTINSWREGKMSKKLYVRRPPGGGRARSWLFFRRSSASSLSAQAG